ncbi:hypothetical protein LJR255_004949 [Pararhizobium sp. LjRoot255]|uniref:hypothetical protein n=1 Tax=Pararhizobium sp. LjRoot255 TaxID=3342298 RepID=UPI003ECEBB75
MGIWAISEIKSLTSAVHAGERSLFLAFAAGAGERIKKTPFFSQNEERRQERGSISSAAGLSVDHIAFTSD